jgi:hypothetical protein
MAVTNLTTVVFISLVLQAVGNASPASTCKNDGFFAVLRQSFKHDTMNSSKEDRRRRKTSMCTRTRPRTSSVLPLACTVNKFEREEVARRNAGAGMWIDEAEDEEDEEDFELDDYEFDSSLDKEVEDYGGGKGQRENLNRWNMKSRHEEGEEMEEEEHPMRTDEWIVQINISPLLLPGKGRNEAKLFPNSSSKVDNGHVPKRERKQKMKFSKNGFVVIEEEVESNAPRRTKVGKWKMDSTGIAWEIPVQLAGGKATLSTDDDDIPDILDPELRELGKDVRNMESTTLHYHADIHLSKFQDQPRMFKGVVTRDRYHDKHLKLPFNKRTFVLGRNIMRPVIATFTAEGIGEDTVDTKYKERGIGVQNPNGKNP